MKLPDELDDKLRHEAERRGVTVSDLTRMVLAAFFETAPDGGGRRFGAAAAGHSGRSDVSSRIKEILRKEWGR
ncbi:ribbon-helix-helix CopG family protein [Nocardia tenerifensis]|uniref:Ribbon-helix-helix CopG family protein n=1 Tax=Nocardia tenerifensis TaxID=228006 RepID=A0A318KB18_9NOCA|nr:ribbon-helix-helix CopG family protein [Nocardia tenerifensis]